MRKIIKDAIIEAEGRALATNGPHGLNVVPISVAHVKNGKIHLYNFFMKKTIDNIQEDNNVAFSFWTGLSGMQIRARASYITDGEAYRLAKEWAKEEYPDRILSGILILDPVGGFSVSALDNPGGVIPLD